MAMPPPPPPGQGPTPPPPPPPGPPPGTPGAGTPGWGTAPPPPGAVTTAPGYGAAPYAPVGGERAGFGIRLGGYLLDGLLYGLLGLVFLIPAVVMGVVSFADCELRDNFDGTSEIVCPDGAPDAGLLVGAVLLGIAGYLIVAFIYVRALGATGQTWGRRIVGIKVVGETSGEPLGFGRALGRQLFAVFISGQIIYLGYLWMLWDDKKQTWHDKVVNSIVVKT